MTPTREERIGRHAVSLYADRRGECGIVCIEWRGDVRVDDARAVMDLIAPHIAQHTPIFVTDLSRLGHMPSAAMTLLAGRDLPQPAGPRHVKFGFSVANLRTRVVVSLILAATGLTSSDKMETQFFPTVEEALAWAKAELDAAP